tara:strand:+ start:191 stop:610 length:420 start_codon:yes stop_codon:yes gene_type:complete
MVSIISIGAVLVGGVTYYIATDQNGVVSNIAKDKFDELKDAGVPVVQQLGAALEELGDDIKQGLVSLGSSIGNELLELIEGAGVALVKGLDRTADYVYERTLAGREPDIIAGFTVTILSIGAAVYLYQSVKNSNDAFRM